MESYQGSVYYEESDDNFEEMTQTVRSDIQKISQNVTSMSKIVNQLQTSQDGSELKNQLRQIQHYTQNLVKDTSSKVMKLMKQQATDPAKKLTCSRLSDDFITTLNSFQAVQKLAAEKTKEDVKNFKAQNVSIGDNFTLNNSGNQDLMEMGSSNQQNRHSEQEQAQCEKYLVELEEREKDIKELENDIMDVNQLFKDIATMIHSQGAAVDSIETNVEYTVVNIESGAQQLKEASNYKNKLRKKKVYITLILIIIISIILISVFSH